MHANARLTVHGRRELIDRICCGRPVARVAAEMGISRATAYKWWRRWRAEGEAGLWDRSSRPHRCPQRTPRRVERRIERLRRETELGPARIAGIVEMHSSTVHRVLVRQTRTDTCNTRTSRASPLHLRARTLRANTCAPGCLPRYSRQAEHSISAWEIHRTRNGESRPPLSRPRSARGSSTIPLRHEIKSNTGGDCTPRFRTCDTNAGAATLRFAEAGVS